MSSRSRLVLAVFVNMVVAAVATTAFAAAVLYRSGSVRVEFREKSASGSRLSLKVPGLLARVAVDLAPMAAIERASSEVREWMPALRAACDALERVPDSVLVEVRDAKEHVRIAKTRGEIVILVDTSDETVEVAVPLAVARDLAARLGGTPARDAV